MTGNLRLAYLVCATPRSGSTLLCEMLRETGQAGRPLEHFEILRHSGLPRQPREYFAEVDAPDILQLLEPTQPGVPSSEPCPEWWARVLREGMTANGVWGGKLMWGHVEEFLGRARELPGLAGADLWNALDSLLDDPALIFVTRADKVYQAVSLWRAVQTQAWRAGGNGAPSDAAVYHFKAIDHLVCQLDGEERAWQSWFASAGLHPITVQYEELDVDPRGIVTRVLHALGLDEVRPPWFPALPRQRDERSVAWVERYERERQRVTAA